MSEPSTTTATVESILSERLDHTREPPDILVKDTADHTQSDKITTKISLPDHDPHDVTIYSFPSYTIDEPDSVSIAYHELVERAHNGDLDAAHSLFRLLRNCREFSYRSKSDLEAAVLQLYQEHAVPSPTGEQQVSLSTNVSSELGEATDLVEEERWLRKLYSQCDGVSDEQLREAEDWLRFAGENGSLPALRELTVSLPRGQEKFDYFEMAWEGGDIFGLFNMAFLRTTGWNGQERDLVQAYAGYLLFEKLMEASGTPRGYERWLDSAREQIEASQRLLQEEELADAIDLADEMLSANSQCCVGPMVSPSSTGER